MMSSKTVSIASILFAAFALAACNKAPDPATAAATPEEVERQAKEEDLARREAELAMKEKEADLARREAALAKPATSTSKPKPATTTTASTPRPAPAASGPRNYTVPAGTSIEVQLPAAITTKNARVGDRVSAHLTNDLVVDGKVIAKAGNLLQGSVSQVISGSDKIGGTPTLGLTFDNLTLADGSDTMVRGSLTQVGKSETGKDAAKIAGGAVAGAVIGHQVDGNKGKIIGGVLGALAGTAAAKKTGKEVELPAGTVLGFTLDSPVNVTM